MHNCTTCVQAALKEGGQLMTAVSASLRTHSGDAGVRGAARDLIEIVVSLQDTQGYMARMEAMVAALTGGEGAETEEIAELSYAVGALSVVSDNLVIMMQVPPTTL